MKYKAIVESLEVAMRELKTEASMDFGNAKGSKDEHIALGMREAYGRMQTEMRILKAKHK